MFYVDKLKNDIWAIEFDNNYTLRNIGRFPNVSSFAFINNQLYIASRTKSRVAIVDYSTLGLVSEFTTVNKPLAMQVFDNFIYVLGAQNNELQKIDTVNGQVSNPIALNTGGFSTRIKRIKGTDLAVIIDIKQNKYTIYDLANAKILKTYAMTVPINDVIIADKVKLFE